MTQPPKVFISYSHDSPEHKKWVATFSSRLMENGINVILDQWDLGLGDDVPKFMEKSVTSSDRVLMICSEVYVHKANDGTGGVGYEAMIVTGELVSNLGTSKFIPVIRQKDNGDARPHFMVTRLYINMNEDNDEQFDVLLRELHKVPAITKPALGKSPFAKLPSGEEIPKENSIPVQLDQVSNPIETYHTAIKVAKAGDLMQWRELTRNARKRMEKGLNSWSSKTPLLNDNNALIAHSLEGISECTPLISIALAGVASGRNQFVNQVSLFEEILNPKGWNRNGLTVVVNLPESAAFIYQALHGAMCLYTDQVSSAINMVRSNVDFLNKEKPIQIWQNHQVIGWPDSFGHNADIAWKVLETLPEKYQWIKDIFGDEEEYLTALVAYYIILNLNEYVYVLKTKQEQHLEDGKWRLDIPLSFLRTSEDVKRRAYRLVLQNKAEIKNIWRSWVVTDEKFVSHWDKWVELCSNWSSRSDYGLRLRVIHSTLPQDLGIMSGN